MCHIAGQVPVGSHRSGLQSADARPGTVHTRWFRRRVQLVAAHTLFGRTDSCQLRLADSTVSAQHLEVSHKGERWYAEDLGSKNGTRLNGTPINPWSPAPLADGDVLKLGNCLVRIEIYRQPFVAGTGPVDPKRRQIKLTGNQRQFAAALVRQYRTPGLLAPARRRASRSPMRRSQT